MGLCRRIYNFVFCIVLFSAVNCSIDLYCRDENNEKVDWFVNYKIPKLDDDFSSGYLAEGKAYTYMTSSQPDHWKLSSNSITKNSSMLGLTVQHLFDVQNEATYLFYNDEPPNQNGTAVGHLKGIFAFDGKSGFWLVHSIPKFCNPEKFEYPHNALMYGQSILCISLPTSAVNEISKQLLFSHPKIYKSKLTDEVLPFLDPKTKTIFTKKPAFVNKPPFKNTVILKTLNKEVFMSFAKDNQLREDLYSEIVAPGLGTPLATETWRKGSGTYLPPFCDSEFSVLNIVSISMTASKKNIAFMSTDDHSKWAVSTNSSRPWICIGDINRMESQFKRGGGTVCFQYRSVWKAYSSIISETDKCPDKSFTHETQTDDITNFHDAL